MKERYTGLRQSAKASTSNPCNLDSSWSDLLKIFYINKSSEKTQSTVSSICISFLFLKKFKISGIIIIKLSRNLLYTQHCTDSAVSSFTDSLRSLNIVGIPQPRPTMVYLPIFLQGLNISSHSMQKYTHTLPCAHFSRVDS